MNAEVFRSDTILLEVVNKQRFFRNYRCLSDDFLVDSCIRLGEMEPLMRRKILKEKFDITTDEDFMEVFDDMCNLSDGVYLDGVEKGIMQGEARGIEKGRLEMLRQFMSNNHTFEEFTQLFNITDKNEIKFLRENL